MEELQAPHVHMADPDRVESIIAAMIEGGKDKLQVIADFDRTLSRFSYKGMIVPTCHGIIDESTLLPESYRREVGKHFLLDIHVSLATNLWRSVVDPNQDPRILGSSPGSIRLLQVDRMIDIK
jgi:hypothetical protein